MPPLYIARRAVIRVQPGWGIYFLAELGRRPGREQAWGRRAAIPPLPAPCPTRWLCGDGGAEGEFVEGSKNPPLAPRGLGGCLRSGARARTATRALRAGIPRPRANICWVTGLMS